MNELEPPSDPVVVVTVFRPRYRRQMIPLTVLHWAVKRQVRRDVAGLIGAASFRNGLTTLVSVSVWRSMDDACRIGYSSRHVWAAHWCASLRIAVSSAFYTVHGTAQDVVLRVLGHSLGHSDLAALSHEPKKHDVNDVIK